MAKVLRYAGFAEESSYNPSPAPAATFHVDQSAASLDTPNDTNIIYGGGLGRAAMDHRPGFYAPSGNIAYAMDIDTIGSFLKWALGGIKSTNGAVTNTVEYWGSNDSILPSFTTRLGKDELADGQLFEHVFTGCVINSLNIQVDGEFCVVTVEVNAAKDSADDIKDMDDLLLPTPYKLAFHDVTCKIGDSDISSSVKSLTINIANNLSTDSGRGIGSRHPRRIPAGGRTVTISANLWYNDLSFLKKYWGGDSAVSAAGSSTDKITVTFNSGTYGTLDIVLPKVLYTQVQQQASGRDEIVQSIAGTALADGLLLKDNTPIKSDIYAKVDTPVPGEPEEP